MFAGQGGGGVDGGVNNGYSPKEIVIALMVVARRTSDGDIMCVFGRLGDDGDTEENDGDIQVTAICQEDGDHRR